MDLEELKWEVKRDVLFKAQLELMCPASLSIEILDYLYYRGLLGSDPHYPIEHPE